jgi:hypothetical protein
VGYASFFHDSRRGKPSEIRSDIVGAYLGAEGDSAEV